MSDLVTFLRARYDEEAAELERLTSGALVQGYLRVHGDRLKADIGVKRRILDDMVPILNDFDDIAESEGQAPRHPRRPGEYLGDRYEPTTYLLHLLAEPYADRPDYAALAEQAATR